MRPASWYEEHGVDARFGTRAAQIDTTGPRGRPRGRRATPFDRLLVSDGGPQPAAGRARRRPVRRLRPPIPPRRGARSGRRPPRAPASCAWGWGSSAQRWPRRLRSVGCDVTVVEVFETTLYRILGREIGRVLEAIHRDHGRDDALQRHGRAVRGRRPARARRHRRRACRSTPTSRWSASGPSRSSRSWPGTGLDRGGGIPVDADAARRPSPASSRSATSPATTIPSSAAIRVEHYDNAVKMGEHVAQAMLGSGDVFDDPHWFWSDQYDSKVEMAGFAPTWDRMVVRGSLEDRTFCAFLLDDGGVLRSTREPRLEARRPEVLRTDQGAARPGSGDRSPIPTWTCGSSSRRRRRSRCSARPSSRTPCATSTSTNGSATPAGMPSLDRSEGGCGIAVTLAWSTSTARSSAPLAKTSAKPSGSDPPGRRSPRASRP